MNRVCISVCFLLLCIVGFIVGDEVSICMWFPHQRVTHEVSNVITRGQVNNSNVSVRIECQSASIAALFPL